MANDNAVYWLSPVGPRDDFGFEVEDEIIDAKTAMGPWALMTPASFRAYGCGKLGLGLGQRYVKQDDGRWLKVEGQMQIWYMRPEWFRDGMIGCKPDPANLDKTHVHLRDVEGISDLESVFAFMQGEVWSPNGEARPLIEEKGLRHTSMSVGDVIVDGANIYIVAQLGFELLS